MSMEEGPVAVVVPDGCATWQRLILERVVGLLGGRVVRDSDWPKERARALAQGAVEFRLPSLDKELPPPLAAQEAAAKKAKAEEEEHGDVEVEIVHATGGNSIWVTVNASSNIGTLKRAIADRCGDDEAEVVPRIRLMRRWSASTFLPFQDDAPVGQRRRFLTMGVNFAGVPARLLPAAPGGGTASVFECPKDVNAGEAARFLSAAMELLEKPQVMNALATLDARSGGTLAAWEPPWEEEGFEDLDLDVLATIPVDKVRKWAQSFVEVFAALASKAG